jgi:hypothetical protein
MIQGELFLKNINEKDRELLEKEFKKEGSIGIKVGDFEREVALGYNKTSTHDLTLGFREIKQVENISKEQMLKALDVLKQYIDENTP